MAQHLHTRRPVDRSVPTTEPPVDEQADVTRGNPVAVEGLAVGDGPDPLGGARPSDEMLGALRRRRGRGQRLPAGTADSFGEQFGVDLSGVRLHTDAEAGRIARTVGAAAFALGEDIYVADGQTTTGSAGEDLLAHELAHVAQTHGGTPNDAEPVIGRADDPAEAEADRMAGSALSALRGHAAGSSVSEPLTGTVDPAVLHRITLEELRERRAALRPVPVRSDDVKPDVAEADAVAAEGTTDTDDGTTEEVTTGEATTGEVTTDKTDTDDSRTGNVTTDKTDTDDSDVDVPGHLAATDEIPTPTPAEVTAAGGTTPERLMERIVQHSSALAVLAAALGHGASQGEKALLRMAALRILQNDPWIGAMLILDYEDLFLFIQDRREWLVDRSKEPAAGGAEVQGVEPEAGGEDTGDATDDGAQSGPPSAETADLRIVGGFLVRGASSDSSARADTTAGSAPAIGDGWESFVVGEGFQLRMASVHGADASRKPELLPEAQVIISGAMVVTAGVIKQLRNDGDPNVPSRDEFAAFLRHLDDEGASLQFAVSGFSSVGDRTAEQILTDYEAEVADGSPAAAPGPADEPAHPVTEVDV